MQWKALLLLASTAAVEARLHGHNRRHGHANNLQARDDIEIVETSTVIDWDYVTLTTTIYDQPTELSSTSTLEVVEATTSTPAPVETSSTSTSTTEISTSSTPTPTPTEVETTPSPTPTTMATTTSVVANEDFGISIDLSASLSIGISIGITESESTTSTTAATSTIPTSASATTTEASNWTATPSSGVFSTAGFGGRTNSSGSGIEYSGNVGDPWGSNIIEVSADNAYEYKYVVQLQGSNTEDWFVSFWNKIGPNGGMNGWYGYSALNFTLAAGETKYVAFDEDSQGGWGAAEGDSLPTDDYGGYSCTWGEFDFGDTDNDAWSGWDVSAIQAQNADQTVQGMKICEASGSSSTCSYITTDAAEVVNAYTSSEASVDGIGGTCDSDAVRLTVHVDYS